MLIFLIIIIFIKSQYNCEADKYSKYPFKNSPSWCKYLNPFIAKPDDLLFHSNNVSQSLYKDYYCYEKNCKSIIDIKGIEFDDGKLFLIMLLVEGKIVYYLPDGTIHLIFNVTNNCLKNQCFFEITQKMDNTNVVLASLFIEDTMYYLEISYDSKNLFHSKLILKEKYELDIIMMKIMNIYNIENEQNDHYLLVLSQRMDQNVIDFIHFNEQQISHDFKYTIMNYQKARWVERNISFDIMNHYVDFDHSVGSIFVENAARSINIYIIILDPQKVKIIPFTKEDKMIYFDNLDYVYYVSTNILSEISSSTYLGELVRELDFEKSVCGKYVESKSQPITLVVSETELTNQSSFIVAFDMVEFSNNTFYNVWCNDYHYYYNGTACTKRKKSSIHFFIIQDRVISLQNGYFFTLVSSKKEIFGKRKLDIDAICDLYLDNPSSPDRLMLKQCIDYDASSYGCDIERLKQNDDIRRLVLSNYLFSTLFVVTDFNVLIYSNGYNLNEIDEQYYFDVPHSFYLHENSFFQAKGNITSFYTSKNSFYFFFVLNRVEWEIDSIRKHVDLCKKVSSDSFMKHIPGNIHEILLSMKKRCVAEPPELPSLRDFIQVSSACSLDVGNLCSSIESSYVKILGDGVYVQKPFYEKDCDKNYYCKDGKKFDCPDGYRCNNRNLKYPIACESDSFGYLTCINKKKLIYLSTDNGEVLQQEERNPLYKKLLNGRHACPLGNICMTKYSSPMYVPPSMKQALSVLNFNQTLGNHFVKCSNYEWCPLGSFWDDRLKPGLYCNRSCIKPSICTKGYYCPDPTKKKICPKGHYCVEGSVVPKRCFFLTVCKEGSDINGNNFFGLIIIIFVLLIIYLLNDFFVIIDKLLRWSKLNQIRISSYIPELKSDANFTIDLCFKGLNLKLKSNGNYVVNSVNGNIEKGQVTMVMGLSGCGKTSLITALAGKAYYGNTTGQIFVNGYETNLNSLKKLVAFVPQEDVMYRVLTVEETLLFSAKTRCSNKSITNEEIKDKVDEILKILGLEEIRHSLIGDENVRGISGGQRKRVNIGIELVAQPVILFLDEPTSGLDSASSSQVCDVLKNIADTGINVITVIHQPRYEIYNQFDNLLLLAKGGSTIYTGKVADVEKYFQEHHHYICPPRINPADFILDVCSGRIDNTLGETHNQKYFSDYWKKYKDGDILKEIEATKEKHLKSGKDMRKIIKKQLDIRKKSIIVQFIECMKRVTIMRFRDLRGIYIDIFLIIVGSFFLGFLFTAYSISGSVIFKQSSMIVLLLGLCAIMGSLSTFGENRAIFIREFDSGLISICHFLACNIIDIVNILVSPLIFLCIFFFLAAPFGNFFMYYLVGVSLHFSTYGLGYMMSLIFRKNSRLASIVVMLILNFFSGIIAIPRDMSNWNFPLNYVMYCTHVFYAIEAIVLIEVSFFKKNVIIYDEMVKQFKNKFLYDMNDLGMDFLILFIGFGIMFRIIAYILLVSSPPDSIFHKSIDLLKNVLNNSLDKIINCKDLFKSLRKKKYVPILNIPNVDEISNNNDISYGRSLRIRRDIYTRIPDNDDEIHSHSLDLNHNSTTTAAADIDHKSSSLNKIEKKKKVSKSSSITATASESCSINIDH